MIKMRGCRLGVILLLSLVCLFVAGCASMKSGKKYEPSGFLNDYSRLEPDPDNSGAMLYRNKSINIAKYNKVMFERIQICIKNDAEYKGVDPTELKALTDYFHDSVISELKDAYPIVTETGPDVLRLRVAITELVPTKPAVSVITLVVPYATVGDLASGAISKGGMGSAPYLGDVALEAMGLDGMTNEVVFEYMERRAGKKYDIDLSEGPADAVVKGYGQYFKAYTTWGYVKDAFDYWAKKFRKRLDEVHNKALATKPPASVQAK